jgi:hypothetical protein
MKRKVSVEVTCLFEFEIDDEAVSDWDGAKILEVLEKRRGNDPAVYTEDATMQNLLGHLGIELCVNNRTMGNFDGWADFPADAATGSPYAVDWDIQSVFISNPDGSANWAEIE